MTHVPTYSSALSIVNLDAFPQIDAVAVIGAATIRERTFVGILTTGVWDYASLEVHFDSILDICMRDFPGSLTMASQVWIMLQDNTLAMRYISINWLVLAAYDFDEMWELIESARQSDDEYEISRITVKWIHHADDEGSGRYTIQNGNPLGSRSIIPTFYYGDQQCCQRALMLLFTYKHYMSIKPCDRSDELKADWRMLRRPVTNKNSITAKKITACASALSQLAQVDTQAPINFTHLKALAASLTRMTEVSLPNIRCEIQIFSSSQGMNLVFSTRADGFIEPDEYENIHWYDLLLDKKHYTPIKHLSRLLGNQNKYCYSCKRTYQRTHVCNRNCSICGDIKISHFSNYQRDKARGSALEEWIECKSCNRLFYGDDCHDQHLLDLYGKGSMCDTKWKCKACKKNYWYPRPGVKPSMSCHPDDHRCGDYYCRNCKAFVSKDHKCYMVATPIKKKCDKYLFSDYESTQETGTHLINLGVTQELDGTEWPIHTSVTQWLDYLLNGDYGGYTVLFHNGKGYDFQFILKEVINRHNFKCTVKPIMAGGKILYFTLTTGKRFSAKTGIRFVDSLNFLPMPLKAFTKTFDLKTVKGYYPHYHNTVENTYYIGPMPPESDFGVSTMSTSAYVDFKVWYEENKNTTWNNYDEIRKYCRADVTLLREGCTAFRDMVMKATGGHDPFQEMTLASSAMQIFRSRMLVPESIAAFSAHMTRELRPALAGGRTGCSKLYYKAKADERIQYFDYTSHYPKQNKTAPYPIGHPEVVVPSVYAWNPVIVDSWWNDVTGDSKLSIWKVDVTCPQHLYHPLLHSKDPTDPNARLMFDLQDKVGLMYTNIELKEARRLGYKITKVYKVWFWGETVNGIFAEYINTWLKIKQQAAGWPRVCLVIGTT